MNAAPPAAIPTPYRARRWPAMVIGLLVCQAGGMFVLMRSALSDDSFVVEPMYYERALRWDQEHAARDRASKSDWTWTLRSTNAASGGITFDLNLVDKSGQTIRDAVVNLELFPVARPGERLRARAIESGPGEYRATVPSTTQGDWELRISVLVKNAEYVRLTTVAVGAESNQP